MPRENLYQLALDNREALKARFKTLHISWPEERQSELQAFHDDCAQQWRVSINMDWRGLKYFLEHEKPYNRYRFKASQGVPVYLLENHSDQTPIDWGVFKSHVDPIWGPRRKKFNEFAHKEEEFTYGGYYVQGFGIRRYGRYLMVLKHTDLDSSLNPSFLKADSLQCYLKHPEKDEIEATLRLEELKLDIACADSVTWLLCIKKAEELLNKGRDYCMKTIMNSAQYIEAQIHNQFGFQAVEKIRIPALNRQEAQIQARYLISRNLLKADELDTSSKRNVYYYNLFTHEFPKRGITVEEF